MIYPIIALIISVVLNVLQFTKRKQIMKADKRKAIEKSINDMIIRNEEIAKDIDKINKKQYKSAIEAANDLP